MGLSAQNWHRIKDVFESARGLPAASRSSYVASACAGDTTLRHEVETLLAAHDRASSFLETPAAVPRDDPSAPAILEGERIGPYQIASRIGAGGMGEVYAARDTKLNRSVAIKVLLPAVASNPDRLARFSREAQVLASLNHPHIAQIYGLEDTDPPPGSGQPPMRALVMELVEGPTLADRLANGAIPVSETLRIAEQIAQALEAAHEQGIVHRDLKPGNIKVRSDAVVKVLDFGLAKILEQEPAATAPPVTGAMTVTGAAGTEPGMIFGTAAYMSPEQARGYAVDKRTDIWAFGCVLYEALTGHSAFKGQTSSDTIVSVLTGEPKWDDLPAATPAGVCTLLRRCLEKDPTRRLRDIGEARIELGEAVATPRQWRPTYRAAGVIGLALVLLVAGGAWLFYAATSAAPVTIPSEYTQLTNFADSAVAPSLSPDGRMVTFKRGGDAFVSTGDIYVKQLPNGDAIRLTDDANRKSGPVFTPDGSRIAFTSGFWDTWIVGVNGGPSRLLMANASGLTWMADNRLLFAEVKSGQHMGIVTALESRAERREIYFPEHERSMAHYAYASPDRQSVLIVEMGPAHAFGQPCRLAPLDGTSAGREVGPRGVCTSAAWSPDGRWMYFSASVGGSSHIWRQKFPGGAPEQITFGPSEEEGVTVAPDGRSLVTSIGTRRSTIWIHDAAGERVLVSEGYAEAPRFSLDGTHLFYLFARDLTLSVEGWTAAAAELRSANLTSGVTERVLPGVSMRDYEVSRDEKEVAFTATDNDGVPEIWLAALDRRTPPRRVASEADRVSFGADGHLVFRSLADANAVFKIKRDGTGRERVTTAAVLDKYGVSPDGEWVMIWAPGSTTNEAPGTFAVPIRGGAPRKICDDCLGRWSPDGRFLYVVWRPTPGTTVAIPVSPGQSLPALPVAGVNSFADGAKLPGARVIAHEAVQPGPDTSTYVFTRTDQQRNLFRIPLH